MPPIGFSTGSLAFGNFRLGLQMVEGQRAAAIELSALREGELVDLVSAIDELELDQFSYIAVHAPSKLERLTEEFVVDQLKKVAHRGWPIVLHPDVVRVAELWRPFGGLLCIENMDIRKSTGRTTNELNDIFEILPEASLCFDIGHARQVDPTMSEAELILKTFQRRIRQVHVSSVGSKSNHEPLNFGATRAFQRVAHLLPADTPIILETPVLREQLHEEILAARDALCVG